MEEGWGGWTFKRNVRQSCSSSELEAWSKPWCNAHGCHRCFSVIWFLLFELWTRPQKFHKLPFMFIWFNLKYIAATLKQSFLHIQHTFHFLHQHYNSVQEPLLWCWWHRNNIISAYYVMNFYVTWCNMGIGSLLLSFLRRRHVDAISTNVNCGRAEGTHYSCFSTKQNSSTTRTASSRLAV